jgi:hypothetical protein
MISQVFWGSNFGRKVGDIAGFKTFKNPVLSIRYPNFASFSDMSKGCKIFSHVRNFVLNYRYSKVWITLYFSDMALARPAASA